MPESQLNILVKVSGQNELNDLFQKIEEGTDSIDDQSRALKLGKALYKSWGAENDILKPSLAATMRMIEDKRTKAMEPLMGANARLMKSYFTLGEELRRFYREQRVGNRTMSELTQTFGQFGTMLGIDGIGGVVGTATGAFQQMEFAVTAAGLAAQRGTGIIATLGSRIVALAGPLAATAAGVSLLVLAMKEADAITKRLNEALDENARLLREAGKITSEQYVKSLDRQIATLRAKEISPSFWASLLGRQSMLNDALEKMIQRDNEILKLEILRNKEQEKNNANAEKQLTIVKKIADEEEKRWQAYRKAWTEGIRVTGTEILPADELLRGRAAISMARPGVAGETITDAGFAIPIGEDRIAKGGKAVEAMREEMEKVSSLGKDFGDSVERGMQNATAILAEGFIRAFNLGDSLIARFGAGLLSAVTQAFAAKAAKGLFDVLFGIGAVAAAPATGGTSLIPAVTTIVSRQRGGWIHEPVAGIGMRSRSIYTIAETGSEYVSAANQVGQQARYGREAGNVGTLVDALHSIQWRLQGLDIVATYERNRAIKAGRSW